MFLTRGLILLCLAGYALQAPPLGTVLSRARDYIQQYERTLGMMIARETYVQRVPIQGASTPTRGGFAPLEFRRQRLLSDFLMVRLESEGDQWMGFRAVLEVNGRPVPDRLERLQELLAGPPVTVVERWRALAEESARYNIGSVARSTNVPTFALLVLREANRDRFVFEHADDARVEGLRVWVIRYREQASPTIIRDRRGGNVFAHGRLWIDPTDGRLVRTEMRTGDNDSAVRSEITVRYRPEAALGVWMPHEMKERYSTSDGRDFEATATYSDFQQFGVSVETDLRR